MAPDWAALQNDILFEIGKHITSIESYDSFSSVCRSWRAAAPRDKHHLRLKTFATPLLILPQKELSISKTSTGRESRTDMLELLNVSTGKTGKIFFPEVTKRYYLSWKDWLFIYEKAGVYRTNTSLFHIVSRVQIQLPVLIQVYDLNNIDTVRPYRLESVVLTANPNLTSDVTVIVLFGYQLYFNKLGNNYWTAIDPIEIDGYRQNIILMVYQKNYLYTYDHQYGIVRWDVNGANPTKPQHKIYGHLPPQAPPCNVYFSKSLNMVEFSNKLYFVYKYSKFIEGHLAPLSNVCRTKCILVYEGIIEDDKLLWTEIQNLGNKAIFFSRKSSFMVECSKINKCKPNCIYFTNESDYNESLCNLLSFSSRGDGQDMGIFHLSDGRVEDFIDEKIEWIKFLEPMWIGQAFDSKIL